MHPTDSVDNYPLTSLLSPRSAAAAEKKKKSRSGVDIHHAVIAHERRRRRVTLAIGHEDPTSLVYRSDLPRSPPWGNYPRVQFLPARYTSIQYPPRADLVIFNYPRDVQLRAGRPSRVIDSGTRFFFFFSSLLPLGKKYLPAGCRPEQKVMLRTDWRLVNMNAAPAGLWCAGARDCDCLWRASFMG